MRKILINFKNPDKQDIKSIADCLKSGEVIVCPTDTIYGFSCLASDIKAIKKIRFLKLRDFKKPMLILVSSRTMLKKYFKISFRQSEYLKKIWPGKISVILKQKGYFGKDLLGAAIDPAVRLPNNKFLVKIIKKVGEPIVSTSFNLSGQEPLINVVGVEKKFKESQIGLIVDIGQDLKGKSSRLIDLRDLNNIKIIRK